MKNRPFMKRKKVTGEQLRGFVRGTISYQELTGEENDLGTVTLTGGDGYQITLEDLTAGIRHYLEVYSTGTLDINDFFDYWVITLLYEINDLVHASDTFIQPGKTSDDLPAADPFRNPFFRNREELAYYVYSSLFVLDDDRWEMEEEPELLEEALQDILEVVDNYQENEGKTKSEWKLTKKQIKWFVYKNDGDDDLADADEETIALWKKYLEELAAKDDIQAVRILGYACYGDDNSVYPCDWERSRDCMLKLMEIADDVLKAQAANTLGYIYYYGRTSNGDPDYTMAYKYFSLAAFFGYYEAIYKVGDMIMGGKGTPKNETAAFRMYEWVYYDCYPRFLEDGIGHQFADAALRLGGAYQNGKGTRQDLMAAYKYYLEARIAIDNRMKRSHFFGDASVSAGIRDGISTVKKELGPACRQKTRDVFLEDLLETFVFGGVNEVRVKVDRKKTETSITFRRMKGEDWDPEPNFLVTIPQISYCKLSPEIKVSAPASVAVEVVDDRKTFMADKIKPVYSKDELRFYYRKKLVMSVGLDGWYIKAEREKAQ